MAQLSLLHGSEREAGTPRRSKYLRLITDFGQQPLVYNARGHAGRIPRGAKRTPRAALPASPRAETQVAHVAPAPGAPPAGLQRPLAQAARVRARRANFAPGSPWARLATRVPGSQSPGLSQPLRSPRAPGPASGLGRRAGC